MTEFYSDREINELKREVSSLVSSYQEAKVSITNKQKNLSKLNLKKVSPTMLESKNMEIIIPGFVQKFWYNSILNDWEIIRQMSAGE